MIDLVVAGRVCTIVVRRWWSYKLKWGDGDHEKTGQKNMQIRKLLGYG